MSKFLKNIEIFFKSQERYLYTQEVKILALMVVFRNNKLLIAEDILDRFSRYLRDDHLELGIFPSPRKYLRKAEFGVSPSPNKRSAYL